MVALLPRKASVPKHRLGGKTALVFCLAASAAIPCLAQDSPGAVVGTADQITRDDERMRVLLDELKNQKALADALVQRRSERLAAADMAGVSETDAQRMRTMGDIAALEREIERARAHPLNSNASKARTAPLASANPKSRHVPAWWDVYGKNGHTAAAPPTATTSQPPVDDAVRPSR